MLASQLGSKQRMAVLAKANSKSLLCLLVAYMNDSLILRIETVCSPERSVNVYHTVRDYIPEDTKHYSHGCGSPRYLYLHYIGVALLCNTHNSYVLCVWVPIGRGGQWSGGFDFRNEVK
jgi:hypothetical protein